MSNTLSVVDMVAAEALKVAHEKATFIGTLNMQFDDTYRAMPEGGKYGQTLRVRNPNQYVRRKGSRVMDVQDTVESTQTVTVATQDGVDLRFNSSELSQSIGYLRQRYIEPAVSALVSGIDSDVIVGCTKSIYNVAGAAGTVVGSSSGDIQAFGTARAKMNIGLAPKDDGRSIQMDSLTMSYVANALKTLYHPSDQVPEAFREGFVAKTAMATIYENERTYTHANGSDVTGATDSTGLDTAASDGGYTTIIWASGSAITPTVGSVFTLSTTKVYTCHPESKQATANEQQFVITAIDSGNRKITVSPTIYLSGAKQNVCKVDGTALAATDFNSNTFAFVGSASTSYRQNLMYHRDFAAFITAELPLMDDAIKCSRMTKDGLSLRVWQASDIRNDEMLLRIDILYGYKVLRPEWGCRITN